MSAAPTKEERAACWLARDDFWKCLDKSEEDATKCKQQRQQFESSCTNTWLKYFDKRRDYLKYKEKLEKEGYDPITDKSKNA